MAFRKSANPQNEKQSVDMLQLQNYRNSREENNTDAHEERSLSTDRIAS